jgi:hypothetical protein
MNIIVGTKMQTSKGIYKVIGVWSNDEVEFANIKTGEVHTEFKERLKDLIKKNLLTLIQ